MRVNIVSDVHGADGALAKAAEGAVTHQDHRISFIQLLGQGLGEALDVSMHAQLR